MTVLGEMDPLWEIQPKERSRYEEQFNSLKPERGVITGEQAKGFFLQSQLPPNILGQIWALSDTDSDGKMDINEFSIACKLINLKLRGFHIPPTLPPTLKNLQNHFPAKGLTGLTSPNNSNLSQTITSTKQQPVLPSSLIGGNSGIITPAVAPLLPVDPIPGVTSLTLHSNLSGGANVNHAIGIPNSSSQGGITQFMPINQVSNFPLTTLGNPGMPTQILTSVIPQNTNTVSQVPSITPQGQPIISQTLPANSYPAPALPSTTVSQTLPVHHQVSSAEGNKNVERGHIIDSMPPALVSQVSEWAVPHQSKLKYTQLFNTTDRARTGFLSGPQAKTILVQTKLPQAVLAQIWALADSDSDGQINCEEFVLAMHLCDSAKEGKAVPALLPPELVPPTVRRRRGSSFSVSDDKSDNITIQNSVSFEDKRKENFDKGQAELERRRAVLLEAQRKEQEERERKEREEMEKREALRAEQEAKRQQELQKQLQRQREMELEQEEQRRRASEQREAARKELERQRQEEWEKVQSQELESQRMKEQNNVLKLKAKNQSLAIELATLTGKVKELSVKISETRVGVSAVKATIDGMRVTRDTHMSEMSSLKSKLKEQNQRLLLLTQEKAKLEARNKVAAGSQFTANEQVMMAFTNKQITIKQLTEKLTDLQNEVKVKTEDVENNNTTLKELKTQLKNLVNDCETIYGTYCEKRDAVLQLKAGSLEKNNWGATTNSWETPADAWNNVSENSSSWNVTSTAVPTITDGTDVKKYRALYKFESRNPDELSFQPGDIITVPLNQNAEPGWLAGELRGMNGWFPEAYVELADETSNNLASVEGTINIQTNQPLEGILESPESSNEKTMNETLSEVYVSVYRYQSSEVGDLSFEPGETIKVIKKDGAWWTGVIGERSGLFPSNYVEKFDSQNQIIDSSLATGNEAVSMVDDDSVFIQTPAQENTKSQTPDPSSTNGGETPADFEQTKPVTPDFSAITSAQTKISKKGEVATVIAPYQATSSEQLSLARGQLVCIRKKTTTGWWEGELQAKGKKKQVGWFPASYVKVLASRRLSQTTPDLEAEQNIEKVVAMFPYKAMNSDELSFEKDDVITILVKEEATWWRGELKGSTGLFPSNYVMPLDTQSQIIDGCEKQRQDAIQELIDSEKSYTADMALVRQVFEKPLCKSGLITQEQLQKIFLNWREILKGNHVLLKLLQERKQNSPRGIINCIGDILCENLPKMGAYVKFCSSQLSAGALLQQLTESSSAFRELCKQCQQDPRTQGLPLSTFLVKPMQRITKYPLLIAKVLQFTPIDHPDRGNLSEALLRAESLCARVNEGVRQNENESRLEWLQKHVLLDGLSEPFMFNSPTNSLGNREFLHYGVLTKVKSGREVVAFLLSDCLILTQRLKSSINEPFSMEKTSCDLKLYKKPLMVKDITAQKSNDSERGFTLITPNGQTSFLCASVGETAQWIKFITASHEKCVKSARTPYVSRFLGSKDGDFKGRLLVEVMEVLNLESKSYFCEIRLSNQVQYTPTSGPLCKWNFSMQFLVEDTTNDLLCIALFVKYDYRPDDLLDRSEIKIEEILRQTRSGGPILRKVALPKLGTNVEILFKLDLILFSPL